jgi:hypothetical protein
MVPPYRHVNRSDNSSEEQSAHEGKTRTKRFSFYTPSAVDATIVNKSESKRIPAQVTQRHLQQLPQYDKSVSLSQKLTALARGSDRYQIVRLLSSNEYPKMYTLKNVEVEDIAAAEREASGERGVLNGVKFLQVRDSGVGKF